VPVFGCSFEKKRNGDDVHPSGADSVAAITRISGDSLATTPKPLAYVTVFFRTHVAWFWGRGPKTSMN
jgi:hypothetical protein